MVNGGEWITHVEKVSRLVSSKCSKLLSPSTGLVYHSWVADVVIVY